MKTVWIAVLLSGVGVSAFAFLSAAATPTTEPASKADGIAVVELFTSEGCSSCPSADKNLNDLAAAVRLNGRPVYCLAFHVDFWNRLGWVDPFSDPAFSRRQQGYAEANDAQIYTPQILINGQDPFIGSDRQTLNRRLKEALLTPTRNSIDLRLSRIESTNRLVHIEAQASEKTTDEALCIAVVESALVVKIGRGENAGRTLQHDQVVRVFETKKLDAKRRAQFDLEVQANVKWEAASVIAFTQKPVLKAITSVACAPLPRK